MVTKLIHGDNLRELVKGYLAFLNMDGPAPSQTQSSAVSGEFAWQKAVRKCPSQLLDLINSKACRGELAVHFGVGQKSDSLQGQSCSTTP
jgi:DNA mismatch repair protein MLH3